MEVILKEVDTNGLLGEFTRFPYIHYGLDKNFVPPLLGEQTKVLSQERNPFWETADRKLFLAYEKGKRFPKVIGRIAAIIDHRFNDYYDEKTGYFGFFECENHGDIAAALFEGAMGWLREKGIRKVIGPMNPSINDIAGLLVDGFNRPPVVMMPYNPPQYVDFIEAQGFEKAVDLYAYRVPKPVIPERLERVVQLREKKGRYSIRKIDMAKLTEELSVLQPLYNIALKENYAFVPISVEEMQMMAKDLKMIADPDLILIAEVEGKPVGFSLALPNMNEVLIKMNGRLFPFGIFTFIMNRKKVRGLRVLVMGVIPEYRNKGIDLSFYYHTFKNGMAKGYRWAELSWIREDNEMMMRMAENVGAERYKTYRLYRKDI